jgi:UrcA family protein
MKPLMMLAAVATSALLLIPSVATAQTPVSASVAADDLDLTVTADRETLEARVTRTIGKLCAEPGMRGADRSSMENYCIASAKVSGSTIQFASNAKRRPARG